VAGHSPSYKRLLDSSFYSFRFSTSFNLVSSHITDWFAVCLMMFIQIVKLFNILCHIWYEIGVSLQSDTHAWCWLVGKSKWPTCPAETCSVIRMLMSFTRFCVSWRDMSRAHWNAGMQFGGHNYFLCWSGQRRSMEAPWGRGLEAWAMHLQVFVLKIVINTAVLRLNRFIADRQVQYTQH
jgi:hypothetical protein